MPSRYNPARMRQAINDYNRKVAAANRKAIDDYNREARRVNAHNQRVVDDYNREVRRVNVANQWAVDEYNRKAREHNARVRANQQRLQQEIARLNSRPRTVRYTVRYTQSTQFLHHSFQQIETAADDGTWLGDDELFDLAERETANSVAVLNSFEDPDDRGDVARLRDTAITTELSDISLDLQLRWQGALFALHPANPDSARQFCTSSREILVKIVDLKVPDQEVMAAIPNVQLTDRNQVPRRMKIQHALSKRGQHDPNLVNFADANIDNVMDLFGEFNSATHGDAGKFTLGQLQAMKNRVEGAIQFLHRIVR